MEALYHLNEFQEAAVCGSGVGWTFFLEFFGGQKNRGTCFSNRLLGDIRWVDIFWRSKGGLFQGCAKTCATSHF